MSCESLGLFMKGNVKLYKWRMEWRSGEQLMYTESLYGSNGMGYQPRTIGIAQYNMRQGISGANFQYYNNTNIDPNLVTPLTNPMSGLLIPRLQYVRNEAIMSSKKPMFRDKMWEHSLDYEDRQSEGRKSRLYATEEQREPNKIAVWGKSSERRLIPQSMVTNEDYQQDQVNSGLTGETLFAEAFYQRQPEGTGFIEQDSNQEERLEQQLQ